MAHPTHLKPRADAVSHNGRDYVPTKFGNSDPRANTKWVNNLTQFRAVGGQVHFNEDQTEVTLTLPAGVKFACGFPSWGGE